jgi:hypothetical protein
MGVLTNISKLFTNIIVFSWDFSLFVLNIFTPRYKPGNVVPPNAPGHDLKWPEYVPPKEGDSRSACPMLNAMANHGILPYDGRNISFRELNTKIRQTYNFGKESLWN